MAYQGLDVGDYLRRSQGLGATKNPGSFGSAPTTGMFGSARKYRSEFGQDLPPIYDVASFSDDSGTKSLLGGLSAAKDMEAGMAGNTIGLYGSNKANEVLAEAREEYEDRVSGAKREADNKSFWGNLAGTAVSAGVGILLS